VAVNMGKIEIVDGRVTPVEMIPEESRKAVKLRNGVVQIIDDRRCYNWDPGEGMVECTSVATHAGDLGVKPPEGVKIIYTNSFV